MKTREIQKTRRAPAFICNLLELYDSYQAASSLIHLMKRGSDMDVRSQDNGRTVRNLAIFTFLVITLGWLGRWLDSLMGSTASQGIGMAIWIISPLAVSLLLRAFAGDGWKDLEIRPAIRGNVL